MASREKIERNYEITRKVLLGATLDSVGQAEGISGVAVRGIVFKRCFKLVPELFEKGEQVSLSYLRTHAPRLLELPQNRIKELRRDLERNDPRKAARSERNEEIAMRVLLGESMERVARDVDLSNVAVRNIVFKQCARLNKKVFEACEVPSLKYLRANASSFLELPDEVFQRANRAIKQKVISGKVVPEIGEISTFLLKLRQDGLVGAPMLILQNAEFNMEDEGTLVVIPNEATREILKPTIEGKIVDAICKKLGRHIQIKFVFQGQ